MGILDVPAPLFGWLDAQLSSVAPSGLRVVVWGIVGGVVSMLIYRAISAQDRVARAKLEIAQARRELNAYDGEFTAAWPLMRRMLGLSFAQVGRVGWPAVVASLPLLCLLVWVSTAFGYRYPEDDATPDIETVPPGYEAVWNRAGTSAGSRDNPPHIVVRDDAKRPVLDLVLVEPVPVIHKRQWWNTLVANPAGYLPRESSLSSIRISLPRQEFLPYGSDWMRGWETAFFVPLLAASIALKVLIRIE